MQELRRVGPMVVNRAKILAPVDTGRLRASIGPPQYSRTWTLRPQVTVTAGVDYAKMVHDGTAAHWIRPRAARQGKPKRGGGRKPTYLRFEVGGSVVYAREVWHPGTRARPFLDRAVREVTAGRGYTVRES
jgi:hypothetical protein